MKHRLTKLLAWKLRVFALCAISMVAVGCSGSGESPSTSEEREAMVEQDRGRMRSEFEQIQNSRK